MLSIKDVNRTTLECFDALPDDAHIRLAVMLFLFGCSRATFYRYIKKGLIPQPRRFGPRMSVWKVGDARVALKKLRDAEPTNVLLAA